MNRLALLLAWGALNAGAQPPELGTRWVQVPVLPVRTEARADAPVLVHLQQGSRLAAVRAVAGTEFCWGSVRWDQTGFVPCHVLSATPVAPRRAGVGGVPSELRWVAGQGVLLRAAPSPQGAVLARLPLNAELMLEAPSGTDYCPVRTAVAPGAPVQRGHIACRYLAETPVAMERIAQPQGPDGLPNPDFNPRLAFAIEPNWEHLGQYVMWRGRPCDALAGCAALAQDPELAAMRRQLHGQMVDHRDPPRPWPAWTPEALRPVRGNGFEADAALNMALWQALPLPAVRPSWFRNPTELAGPDEPLAELAARFDARQQWFVGELYAPGPQFAGARVERLTKKLHRIDLLGDGRVRAEEHTPQWANRAWLPDNEAMCQNWHGLGYAFGDTDAATRRRNGFPPAAQAGGPPRLFWLHSTRPLPPGPARSERQVFALDRARTGFTQAELRPFDLDADGVPDLLWVEATGRGPGHLDELPKHDDPWLRLLLVNLNGAWHLLSADAISWGCGC